MVWCGVVSPPCRDRQGHVGSRGVCSIVLAALFCTAQASTGHQINSSGRSVMHSTGCQAARPTVLATVVGASQASRPPNIAAVVCTAPASRLPDLAVATPPPIPVTGIAGTCRNVLPERCDSVRLNVFQ